MGDPKAINWNALDPKDRAAMDEVSTTASATIGIYMLDSIKVHKTAGLPIYYRDAAGAMIKEMADGRRWVVHLDEHDCEVELYELKAS